MAAPDFVHLRLHSEYSIADGVVRIEDAAEAAAADGMPALGLVDLCNLFGAVKFYQAARSRGVKPVIGCDLWVSNDADRDKPGRLLLLVQSPEGYLRLCRLLSAAYRGNQHRGRPELRLEWLEEDGSGGLIALSGAHLGSVGTALLQGNLEQARRHAERLAQLLPGRLYLEVQRQGLPHCETHVQRTLDLASELDLPVVATHPVQFLQPGDFTAHEARVCIAEGYQLSDQRRPRHFTPEQYFKTQAQMRELFADVPEALANSVEIAKRCTFSFDLGKARLPLFPTPAGVTLEDYLGQQAHAGLERRLAALFPDAAALVRERPRYEARLEFEVKTIVQMGFAGYFLIVADFINWAKGNGVPVGPGRGSGAGSLVAYSLGITDLDPIRYDLLFERFLNPERVSMPDFDIDFCQDGRDRVIDYVRKKYGEESVSQIATFGTMAAKAVVRDVGRILGWNYGRTDELAKLIPFQPGKPVTLRKREDPDDKETLYARELEPQINEREAADEETRNLLELAEQLEGLTRNVGMHAGGVLIAPGKLTDFCPVYCAEGSEAPVSQFDKDDVEKVGLVKFDFLGLTTLTILDWTLRHVKLLDPESTLALESIPLDDKAAYQVLKSANTVGVFQLESRGMKDMLVRARPDRFEDIIALVALYRPGPMDLIPDFIERKHGRQRVEYPDPRLEPILGPTYGIMVYQEQVMQIAQVIGGYSLGGADLLRRAMGKKKPEEMAKHRDIFVQGAVKRNMTVRGAEGLFALMEKFAGYGFNKSHAAAYALVAYHTAYLKTHHCAAFMAANLSAVMDDTDKVRTFCEDSAANGIRVMAPDVNLSHYRFVPLDGKTVSYGLGAVKGTGEAAIGALVRAREAGGPFRDLFDFCRRVDPRIVNRRVAESLVKAGAFDTIEPNRARLLASVGIAMEAAEQRSRAASQNSLFGEEAAPPPSLLDAPEWDLKERLTQEKSALGFYLSGHPFEAYEPEVAGFVRTRLDRLTPQNQPVLLAGIVHSARVAQTRRGRMASIVLDDATAQVEVAVFSEVFEANRAWIKEDQLLVVEGKVAHDDYSGGLRVTAEKLYDLAAARTRYARAVRLTCNGGASAARLKGLLAPYRDGSCPVVISYRNGDACCELELGEDWRVSLQDNLLRDLAASLKPENVRVVY
ncbi:MAG TPA: DNA polymerase III subunit alpha [Burkholderiales bacterium]